MKRDLNDPRVALVARALDRAAASPHQRSGILPSVGSVLITLNGNCEKFLGWDPCAIRGVTMAYALHAPDAWLDAMTKIAIDQYEWCEWWDAPGGGEHQATCTGCVECDREAA